MTSVLRVRLLGPFAVEVDGRAVPSDAWGRRDAAFYEARVLEAQAEPTGTRK